MITKFNCSCGNTDPKQAKIYDGCLGYSALICKVCGKYYDHNNEYPADDWSKKIVGLSIN